MKRGVSEGFADELRKKCTGGNDNVVDLIARMKTVHLVPRLG
jgi:hypothetical protein